MVKLGQPEVNPAVKQACCQCMSNNLENLGFYTNQCGMVK